MNNLYTGTIKIDSSAFEFVDGEGTYPAVLRFRQKISGLGFAANIVEGGVTVSLRDPFVTQIADVLKEFNVSTEGISGDGNIGDYFAREIIKVMNKK